MIENCELIKEVPLGVNIGPAQFIYQYTGIGINHNYLCAVCREKPAVLNCSNGILNPCRECRSNGHEIVKVTRFGSWFFRFFGMLK